MTARPIQACISSQDGRDETQVSIPSWGFAENPIKNGSSCPPGPWGEVTFRCSMEEDVDVQLNSRQKADLFVEIENCKKNIGFYKDQIDKLEDKMEELERLKKAYEYY